jgi:hypothetical protein
MENAQTSSASEVTIELRLPVSAVNIVLEGLDGLPHKVSRRTIDDIIKQAHAQSQQQLAPAEVVAD